MPASARATKHPEYVDKAIDALKSKPANEIELSRVVGELAKAAQDFERGSELRLVLEGFTLALEGKIQKSREAFNAAVARGGGARAALQMVRMLELVGEHAEAFSVIKTHWDAVLQNPDFYRFAWNTLCRMGYVLSAHKLTQQVIKTGIETESFDDEQAAAFFTQVTEEADLADVVSFINAKLREKRLPMCGSRINLFEIEVGKKQLMYEFFCQLDPVESVDLEAEIIKDVLKQGFPIVTSRAAIFVISPCEDGP